MSSFFPQNQTFGTKVVDVFDQFLFSPLFATISKGLIGLQKLQPTRIHVSAIYLILTLVALIIWCFVARGV